MEQEKPVKLSACDEYLRRDVEDRLLKFGGTGAGIEANCGVDLLLCPLPQSKILLETYEDPGGDVGVQLITPKGRMCSTRRSIRQKTFSAIKLGKGYVVCVRYYIRLLSTGKLEIKFPELIYGDYNYHDAEGDLLKIREFSESEFQAIANCQQAIFEAVGVAFGARTLVHAYTEPIIPYFTAEEVKVLETKLHQSDSFGGKNFYRYIGLQSAVNSFRKDLGLPVL